MKLYYPAVFIKHEFGFTVEFPDLPGCVTQGETLEEAFEMAEDAACGWILTSIEDGEELPKPTPINRIDIEEGFSNYIALDIGEYGKRYGTKSIKKTLTIPEWLNSLAEREGVNFSQELQFALKKRLGLTARALDEEIISIFEETDALKTLVSVISQSFIEKSGTTTTTSSEEVVSVVLQNTNIAYIN